jgi:type I restriction enzyme M protein
MTTDSIISKVWSFCHTLRDDGVGYGDYLEQLTYLIFLKMADEYARPPYSREVGVPAKHGWPALRPLKGAELELHYIETLRELGTQRGMLGQIFTKAQNKIQDPAKLARLIEMVDGISWTTLDADTKGDIYEGILEKNAEDTKSGAGQYFTPRALIKAMVECVAPEPGKTIADPACGTGGFFLSSYDYLQNKALNAEEKRFLKNATFSGNEIVAGTRRLCLMNLFLHNIGEIDGESLIASTDALVAQPTQAVDYVLANPPFGKKSSMTFTNEEGEQEKEDLVYNRQDFWATTSNKQLNFLQHIRSMLKTPYHPAIAHRHLLRAGREGECALLRQPTRWQGCRHPRGLVLRLPHKHSPHAQAKAATLRRPRGFHFLLQPLQPPPARGNLASRKKSRRPVAQVQLLRVGRPRQNQPRPFLAQRRKPHRSRQLA